MAAAGSGAGQNQTRKGATGRAHGIEAQPLCCLRGIMHASSKTKTKRKVYEEKESWRNSAETPTPLCPTEPRPREAETDLHHPPQQCLRVWLRQSGVSNTQKDILCPTELTICLNSGHGPRAPRHHHQRRRGHVTHDLGLRGDPDRRASGG